MGERGLGLSSEGGKMFQDESIASHILRKAGDGKDSEGEERAESDWGVLNNSVLFKR